MTTIADILAWSSRAADARRCAENRDRMSLSVQADIAVIDDTEEVEILATEQRSDGRPGAQLTRVNGKLMCHCPYLCGATGEKCAFDGTEWDPRR